MRETAHSDEIKVEQLTVIHVQSIR